MNPTEALRHGLLALQFFTRFPVTGRLADWAGYTPARAAACAAHLPGVGWLVGALMGGAWWAGHWGWGAPAAAVVAMAAGVLATGALHEDGLADLADGLGATPDRARALAVMKDSRIGTYGALALCLALAARGALLLALAQTGCGAVLAAIVCAAVLSRVAPLAVMRALPYAGDGAGKSAAVVAGAGGRSLAVGTAWALPAVAWLAWQFGPLRCAAAVTALVATTAWLVRLLRRRLHGYTGDALGAAQQLGEIALLATLAWRAGA